MVLTTPRTGEMSSTFRSGIKILMVTMAIAIGVLVGLAIGAASVLDIGFLKDTIPSWIAAFSTVVIALLTIILADETKEMRKLQQVQIDDIRADAVRPDIYVYLTPSDAAFNLAEVVVTNNGNGLARDIRTTVTHIDGCGGSLQAHELIIKINTPSIISNGIATLGPRRELRSYVLSFIEMKDDSQFDICLKLETTCNDVDGNQHKFESIIDFGEFLGLLEIGGSRPLQDIARDLNNICKSGITINSGPNNKKLQVDAYSEDDRIRSEVDREEMVREHKKKRANEALEAEDTTKQ